MRCPASPRHALLAENLGKPSLWVIINAPWYKRPGNPNWSTVETMDLLNGIRIVSVNHFLLGPVGIQLLADLGADVIAVEPIGGA